MGKGGWVDQRMTKGSGLVGGVTAGGRRQSSGSHTHGEEAKLGFPYNGTPHGFH